MYFVQFPFIDKNYADDDDDDIVDATEAHLTKYITREIECIYFSSYSPHSQENNIFQV
jgi:hypothetical protein